MSRTTQVTLGFLGFALVGLVWSIATYGGFIQPLFLPSPSGVASNTIILFREQGFLLDIGISIYRVFGGFTVGAILAIPLGILIGSSRFFNALFEPLIGFMRYLPAAAFIPLAILWFGIGDIEKMFIIFIGTFAYLTLFVTDAVMNVDKTLIENARSFGAPRKDVLFHVIIPASLPSIWDSLRIMAGIGWTYIIVAELVAASSGIGHVIIEAQRYLLTGNIIAGLLVIGLLGLITDQLFKWGYTKLFPYTTKSERI